MTSGLANRFIDYISASIHNERKEKRIVIKNSPPKKNDHTGQKESHMNEENDKKQDEAADQITQADGQVEQPVAAEQAPQADGQAEQAVAAEQAPQADSQIEQPVAEQAPQIPADQTVPQPPPSPYQSEAASETPAPTPEASVPTPQTPEPPFGGEAPRNNYDPNAQQYQQTGYGTPVIEPPTGQPVQPGQTAPYQGDPNQAGYYQAPQGQYQADPYQNQQPYQQQPYYQVPGQPVQAAQTGNGKAIGALICGIFAILLSPSVLFGIILGIVAIILAGSYIKTAGKDGKATGGRICGIFGIVFSVISLFIWIAFFMLIGTAINESEYYTGKPGSSYSYSYDSDSKNETPSLPDSGSSVDNFVNVEESVAADAYASALEGIKNPSAELKTEMLEAYDELFEEHYGFPMSDVGLDPNEVLQASLDSLVYEDMDGHYCVDDVLTAYGDAQSKGLYEIVYTFEEKLDDQDIDIYDYLRGDKANFKELFMEAVSETKLEERYISLDFEQSGDTWVPDESDLDDEILYLIF